MLRLIGAGVSEAGARGQRRRLGSRGWILLALALCGACFNPSGVDLDSLDSDATHFVWLLQTPAGVFGEAQLVARAEEVPVLFRAGLELFVFPVDADAFLRLGVEPQTIPPVVLLRPAETCEPAFVPSSLFRLEQGVWEAVALEGVSEEKRAAFWMTTDLLRGCPEARPDVHLQGEAARGCTPEVEAIGRCEWGLDFGAGCRLSPTQHHWRLHAWPNGGACLGPSSFDGCEVSALEGRFLSQTVCTGVRAVVSRPADVLDVRVARMTHHGASGYGQSAIGVGASGEVEPRSGYLPDLVRLEGGDLIVAASTELVKPIEFSPSSESTLLRVDAQSLEVLSTSVPIHTAVLGLIPDRESPDAVLAVAAGSEPNTLRLVRLGLDGQERETQPIAQFEVDPPVGSRLAYVDGFFAPELEALVVLVSFQIKLGTERYRYWVQLTILDPVSLEVRAQFDTQNMATEVYANELVYSPREGRPRVLLVSDDNDSVNVFWFSLEAGFEHDSAFRLAHGGGSTIQHATEHLGADGVRRVIYSVSSEERSWRKKIEPRYIIQHAAYGLPSITTPLGPDVLLAPQLEPTSGDLEFLLLEPERVDVVAATAPKIPAAGPAGRAVYDGAGTVWMTLPWTGQLARVSRANP